MRFSENRRLAAIVLAVCILVSVFGLGGLGLARERRKVLTVFEEGVGTTVSAPHSMQSYLKAAQGSAGIMASEAELLKVNAQLVDAVKTPAAVIADGKQTLDARYEAYTDLTAAVEALYNAAYDASKQSGGFDNFNTAYHDYFGDVDLIEGNEYHQRARDYNKLASGFPGSLVALLTGQRALNTFGG